MDVKQVKPQGERLKLAKLLITVCVLSDIEHCIIATLIGKSSNQLDPYSP